MAADVKDHQHPIVVAQIEKRAGDLPVDLRDDGQNRQAAFQQAKADHDHLDVNRPLVENTDLTRAVHELTIELHHRLLGPSGESPANR